MAPRDRVGSGRVAAYGWGRRWQEVIIVKGWPGISWGEQELWRWPRCSVLQ
jgi:hypothetical protein